MSKIILKFEGNHGTNECSEVEAEYDIWYLLDQILWKMVEKKKETT